MTDISPASGAGAPVIQSGHTYDSVTDKISSIVLTRRFGKGWWIGFGLGALGTMILTYAIGMLLIRGIGIWGVRVPVAWGFAIVNFVWWIGIGHAGTFISAFLLLLKQDWRTSINRFAEAMTLFAVACAGVFPLLHLGRPWLFYWLTPYPNTMQLWPQWRSALVWDVFAVGTYFTISLVFWYIGLIPDLATLRDRSHHRIGRIVYGILALGWRNAATHWQRYTQAYMLLAGLAAPLVISVHSVVSMDFAEAQLPGWHTTIFPPYFVAGAIFSGFAMVLTLAIPLRAAYGLQDFITLRHINNSGKLLLITGLIVAYGYGSELFMNWYSGDPYEWGTSMDRFQGSYRNAYAALLFCNILTPQLLWSGRVRNNVVIMWIISVIINVGMWLERYVIVVQSLSHDFLPSSWETYSPTVWDWATYIGTIGLFIMCLFLFIRFLPAISIFEMRELVHEVAEKEARHEATD
ncbi:MAG TPA: NrfD/PsrC family molybdoenzyme membrane anchor subunit [Tepidisphaeraceae bacterium]|jgi:molybdopterin-containing oxidoreductase family membrane subunit